MENKNQNQKEADENIKKQVSYTIKTMDSDLKKEGSKNGSFELLNTPTEKDIKTDKKPSFQPIQPPNKTKNKPVFNPFLDNIKADLENPLSFSSAPEKSIPSPENNKREITGNPMKNPPSNTTEKFKKPIVKNEIPTPNYLKNQKNKPLEKNQEKSSFNFFLILFLISLFLISVGSGVYYFYFFNQEKPQENLIGLVENNYKEKTVETEAEIPTKLKNSQKIIFNLNENTDLISELTNKKEAVTELGQYYQVTSGQEILSSIELLNLLDIQFSEISSDELGKTWIYLNKNQENILKMGLIIELNTPEGMGDYFLNNEYSLPQILKPMFIDESLNADNREIVFKNSNTLDEVRYYNFVEGFNDKSIDWKILENKYLLITTSEKTMSNLLKDLIEIESVVDLKEENQPEIENQEIEGNETEIKTTENVKEF